MTKEEMELMQETYPDRPPSYYRPLWDGKSPSGHCPTAREAYALLGKELPKGFMNQKGDKDNETK